MKREVKLAVEIPAELEKEFRLFVVLHGGAIVDNNSKSMLKAYKEECSADAEKTRMLKEISKLPEHIVSERNGFKRSFLEKDTVINIIENLPFN